MDAIMDTGGAGFIGSALIRHVLAETNFSVVNVDLLTCAGNTDSLKDIENRHRYSLEVVHKSLIKSSY